MIEDLKEILLAGETWAVATVTTLLGSWLGVLAVVDPVYQFAAATAGTWFPIAAVSGGTILPEFGYAQLGRQLLIVAAVGYVGILVVRFGRAASTRFKDS